MSYIISCILDMRKVLMSKIKMKIILIYKIQITSSTIFMQTPCKFWGSFYGVPQVLRLCQASWAVGGKFLARLRLNPPSGDWH